MLSSAIKILTWQLLRMGLQAFWAIGLARAIGPSGYGLFAGLAGLATTLGALSGLGFGLLMLQTASRDHKRLQESLSNALFAILFSGFFLAIIYLAIAEKLIEQNTEYSILIAIGISELFCLPVTLLSSYAFQSRDRMGWAGAMYAIGPAGNVLSLLLFWIISEQSTLASYLIWHVWTALTSTAFAISTTFIVLKLGIRRPSISLAETCEASGFTSLRIIDTGLASIDKTMVLRLFGSEAAGHYTAAYRLAALIALPAVSLAISATPRLFRSAHDQMARLNIVKRLFNLGLIIALVSIPASWLSSMAVPHLFGSGFLAASEISEGMMFLPGLLGLSTIGCAVLMASGNKRMRIFIQSAILALLIILIYTLGIWKGFSTTPTAVQISYAALAIGTWSAIIVRNRFLKNEKA